MRSLVALFFFFALSGCGPVVMIPGGALSGSPATVPADWSFTDAVDTVQLETRPSDPYSVNVWAVATGGAIYVAAGGGEESAWVHHIRENAQVRLRVEGNVYLLRAVETRDPAERDAFLSAAEAKYDFEPDPEQSAQALLYRLEAR